MNYDVVTKVLALFDTEDIPFIKARKYIEYKESKREYIKKLGAFNGHRKTKMGRILISRN